MKTIVYARVSTADQTLDHRRAQAKATGFVIDQVMTDHGVSDVSTMLPEREHGRRVFDIFRAGDTLVVRWLDQLGRNCEDVRESRRFSDRPVKTGAPEIDGNGSASSAEFPRSQVNIRYP